VASGERSAVVAMIAGEVGPVVRLGGAAPAMRVAELSAAPGGGSGLIIPPLAALRGGSMYSGLCDDKRAPPVLVGAVTGEFVDEPAPDPAAAAAAAVSGESGGCAPVCTPAAAVNAATIAGGGGAPDATLIDRPRA
jgi:hypothetical protein